MAESVFTRINEYETAKRRKKKIILSTAVPACFLCAAVIAGISIHIAGAGGNGCGFQKQPAGKQRKRSLLLGGIIRFGKQKICIS